MRVRLFIFFLVVFCSELNAQSPCSISIKGSIVDREGHSLNAYRVFLNDSIYTITDSLGNFEFSRLCTGNYPIQVKNLGVDQSWPPLHLTKDTSLRLTVEDQLLSSLYIRENFVGPHTFLGKRTLDKAAIILTPASTLNDLSSQIPGVTGLKTGNTIAKPMIGGMVGRRVVIYNNGVRLEGQDWGSEHGPEIDAQNLSSITVVKGPASLRHAPDALGGLILLESINPKKQAGIDGAVTLTGVSNGRSGNMSAYLRGKLSIAPLSWQVQGSIKRSGNVHAPDYFLKNTGTQERNYSAGISYTKQRWEAHFYHSLFTSKVGIFSGSHIGNLTDLHNAFSAEQPFDSSGFSYKIDRPYQDIVHELTKGHFQFNINEKHQIEANYSRQYNGREEFDKDRPFNDSLAALDLPDFSLEITTHTGEILWSHKLKQTLSGSVGLTGKNQANTHAYRTFIPNFRNRSAGVFWIERYTNKTFGLEAAVRYDFTHLSVFQRTSPTEIDLSEHRFSGLSTSLGSVFSVNKSLQLNANISTGWRIPWVNELYSNGLHHGVAALEYGDPNLGIERSFGVNLSPEYETKVFKLSLDIYTNLLNNYIFLRPADEPTLTIQGAFPTFFFEQSHAWSRGLDFSLEVNLNHWISLHAKGSAVRIQDRKEQEFLPGTPSDRGALSIQFKGKLKQTEWSLSPKFEHVAKQWRIDESADFVAPPEAYNLLGLSGSLKIPFQMRTITLAIGIDNILNTTYRDYLNRFRYYTDDLGRNYSIKLHIPFNINQNEKSKI